MDPAPNLAVLVMAAGQSRRMGRDKLLLPARDGRPLLEHRIRAAQRTGHRVFVALPPDAQERQQVVYNLDATPLICTDAALGLGHSLSQATGQLPKGVAGVLIVLGDMPALTGDDLVAVCTRFDPKRILRGAGGDAPGHPVLIPARFLNRLKSLSGDQGALHALKDAPTGLVPLSGDHACFDVDTPDDWKMWLDRT
ncbi:nucleotidyltransferase family protein [Aliiroseovarius sediminis]|uniref:nucleotidyltransferase family protein n=1 Tax=Aliiroseovarius sediminis TaxID=2925839 RepID=UPI001F580FC8|nr:nucleotidyltransferase family protein [Aliiroseovarius sediminis]MCI2393675.1 nucleotidyltransferase family protein [Aliiroseovarius sediminis]